MFFNLTLAIIYKKTSNVYYLYYQRQTVLFTENMGQKSFFNDKNMLYQGFK